MLSKFKFFFYLLIFFTFSNFLYANGSITIKGNKNISSKTILSLAPANINNLDSNLLNNYQKKIYETGFFETVNFSIANNKLIITVVENPLINFFFIEGVKNNEVKNKLFDISKIRENTIFQSFLIKEDIKNYSDFLKNLGYLNNQIDYQIKKIENNKINIFYNINLNEKFKINIIFFIGNKYFKSSILKDVVFSSEHGWWKFFSNSTTPGESLINYDISKLKQFYLNNGFYDVQINSSTIKIIDNKRANIIYSIDSGSKYIIGDLSIIDNSKSLKKENILYLNKQYNKFLNKNYDFSAIKKSVDFSLDYLSKSNYDLVVEAKIQKTKLNKMKLTYIISEQLNKKLIEKIIVTGNNITDDFVVRNNLLFSEGDFLNTSKLNSSIDKLKGKGYFKNVEPITTSIDDNKVQLTIKVEEQATGEISAGAGAGTNGAALSGSLNEKNFLGKGLNVNSTVNIGTQKIFGKISYLNPDYNNTGKTFKSSIFAENNNFDNTSYENKIIGSSVSLDYEIYDKFFLNPGVSVDFDSLKANANASSAIKRREGDFYTSKLFYNFSKNTKNRDLQPTEGYTIGLGQGLSLLSDIPYINNRFFGSYYHEYLENVVGSVKYKIESINGFNDDIKYSDRLSVSSNNLRGFASRGIGPKIDNDFIGGNYSFYSSFSSTLPNGLPEKWNAITNVFFDSANVWGVDDNSADDSNKIRTSVGLGLSWISPLGPISITYAEPITKESTDEVEQFNFKIGSAF
jgi:outer membrane protein insertion porin family